MNGDETGVPVAAGPIFYHDAAVGNIIVGS
jgi:hypothetical protein